MKRIMTALLMLMAVAICGLAENRIAIFEVSPKMHCENCENKIKSNLRHESGVKRIATSLKKQTVTVTYDSDKTSPEAIAKGFEKIGYAAKPVTSAPNRKAKVGVGAKTVRKQAVCCEADTTAMKKVEKR